MDQSKYHSARADILAFPHMSRKDEQLLQTVLNNIPQGVLMFDADTRLIFCNQRYIEMYGLSPELAEPGCTLSRSSRSPSGGADFCRRPGGIHNQAPGRPRRGEDIQQHRQVGRRPHLLDREQANAGWRMARHARRRHRTTARGRANRTHGSPRRVNRSSRSILCASGWSTNSNGSSGASAWRSCTSTSTTSRRSTTRTATTSVTSCSSTSCDRLQATLRPRHDRAHGRRRVRNHNDRDGAADGCRRALEARAKIDHETVPGRRPPDCGGHQHWHFGRPHRRHRPGPAVEERRHGDVRTPKPRDAAPIISSSRRWTRG